MRETGDLCIEAQARLALLLRDFKLAFLVLTNVFHADFLAERGEDGILGFVDNIPQATHPFNESVVV